MRILYVCTFWGVRSRIAELLTTAMAVPGVTAASAGFESGRIGNLPIDAMQRRGFELGRESPPTVFHYARKSSEFDTVITLCNEASQENYLLLYDMVDMLFAAKSKVVHWNIPDFMNIPDGSIEAKQQHADDIVNDIESMINQYFSAIKPWQSAVH